MSGTTIDFYFDGDDVIIEAKGASIMVHYTQAQGLISQRRNNLSYFYHYDGLGSTKALSDANQNVQSSYKYDVWGNILQSSCSITNPYLYVGELGYYADGDAGMYLLTQRWYSSVVGRFVVRDPLRYDIEDFLNPYMFLYSANNPVNQVDPKGLFSKKWCKDWFFNCVNNTMEEYYMCIAEMFFGNNEKQAIVGNIAALVGCAGMCVVVCMALSPPTSSLCTERCTGGCLALVAGIKYLIARGVCSRLRDRALRECKELYNRCCQAAKQ